MLAGKRNSVELIREGAGTSTACIAGVECVGDSMFTCNPVGPAGRRSALAGRAVLLPKDI